MARKASRSSIAKKAWKTRKANAKAAAVKAQPNRMLTLDEFTQRMGELGVKDAHTTTISSLCSQIDDTLTALETRLTALNARINAIL